MDHGESIFTIPLYLQRYVKVRDFIDDHSDYISTMADLGCSTMKLFNQLKNASNLRKILFVDIDEYDLAKSIWKVRPLAADYLAKRENPLNVTVICTDAKKPNTQLFNLDLITLVEVIEHLYETELPDLAYNVFHNLRPKYVFITTPNSDFNIHFENLKDGGFRHPDHKFEWPSSKFQDWANSVAVKYSYDVKFDGVGTDEDGLYCSQIAIFSRNNAYYENSNDSIDINKEDENSWLVYSKDYPFEVVSDDMIIERAIIKKFNLLLIECNNIHNAIDYEYNLPSWIINNECVNYELLSFEVEEDVNQNEAVSFEVRNIDFSDITEYEDREIYYDINLEQFKFSFETFLFWANEMFDLNVTKKILPNVFDRLTWEKLSNGKNILTINLALTDEEEEELEYQKEVESLHFTSDEEEECNNIVFVDDNFSEDSDEYFDLDD